MVRIRAGIPAGDQHLDGKRLCPQDQSQPVQQKWVVIFPHVLDYSEVLRLAFDTAALRRMVRPACGVFAKLIYFAGRHPNHERHEEQ